jgi:hypothetical protein
MRDTPYGTLLIYYTGRDPRLHAPAAKRFQFNGLQRGRMLLNESEQSR